MSLIAGRIFCLAPHHNQDTLANIFSETGVFCLFLVLINGCALRCPVRHFISPRLLLSSFPTLSPLASQLPIMKSLILRLSYQPLMGEVSCGSNKGKWSYLYARPAARLEQKNLSLLGHICWLELLREK